MHICVVSEHNNPEINNRKQEVIKLSFQHNMRNEINKQQKMCIKQTETNM